MRPLEALQDAFLMRMASQPRKGVFAHRGQPCVGLCASWPMRPLEALRDAFLMRMASQVSWVMLIVADATTHLMSMKGFQPHMDDDLPPS